MSQVSQLADYRSKGKGEWMTMPKGYCQVDNRVQQQLFRVDLNGTQHAIIQAVIQLTWRNQETHAEISPNRLAGLMGRDVKVIQRNMKTLKAQKILEVVNGCVGVNTSVDDWQFGEKKAAASSRAKAVARNRKTAPKAEPKGLNSPPDSGTPKGTEQSQAGGLNSPEEGDQTVPNHGTEQSPLNKKEELFDKELFEKERPRCPVASDPTTSEEKMSLLDQVKKKHPEAVVASRTSSGEVRHGSQADVDLANAIHRLIAEMTMDDSALSNHRLASWANAIRLTVKQDGRTHSMIWTLFQFANQDSFWRSNVLSPATLREKWPKLAAKYNEARHKQAVQRKADNDWVTNFHEAF